MESSFPADFSNFELEITNRCNLACPRCARTDLISMFPKHWKNHDLSLAEFQRFISPVLDKIDAFEFKGTMGDPIFHPAVVDWMVWVKESNKKAYIHTNAQAGKSLWEKLSAVLTRDDQITIGIDGLPEDFMTYRVNAKWKNISDCVSILAGKVRLVWQYIVFSYNEDGIEKARELSDELGFDEFIVVQSNRWVDNNDWLKPKTGYNERPTFDREIAPMCLEKPMHIVTADGFYMPCCYLIDHRFRYKTPWAQKFDIRKLRIDDVIKSSVASEFFANLNSQSAPDYCRFNCGKC